ncbi:hypothetical protein KUL42_35030 [Alteromonas sp. KUL42]|uniref:hypothetical protein n=1 Tax=Alteromonas sp. KUL42 TaxID=2480797 RepID=UPI000796AD95|nr:hypothetical protein [Alteromonas sp. KUL42]KXJ60981.1 MAG: hypothetical protein AXW14_10695 [Alteromonas sp. Nap_26]TAP32572.1 hypothetical protein EYR97_17300 [Alteromonas sp. KUL42]GEA08742.1 hypothetical protein KUL42_35030 [Alteromonas sp. KUL42]
MSAVQLLEQLGANASLQEDKQLANSILDQIGEQNEKMWCFMVPAEEDDEDNTEEEDKTEGEDKVTLQ